MKSLYSIYEGCNVSADKRSADIISIYMKHLNDLPFDKQQHFLTRLNLFMDVDISEHIKQIKNDIQTLVKLFESKKYKTIVDKFVINPYVTTNSKKLNTVGDWLKTVNDEDTLRLLSIGAYLDKKSIVTRHGYSCEDLNIDVNEVYEMLLNDKEILSHNGTLYINCAGYLWNLYHKNIESWRRIRKTIMNGKRTTKNVYGITHILLQASNFYTKPIDSVEYSDELEEINKLLMNYRVNQYRDISLDLLCEMVVCLHYSNRTHSEYLIAKHFIEQITRYSNIIYNTKSTGDLVSDLTNNEHTNILYILLQKTNKQQ